MGATATPFASFNSQTTTTSTKDSYRSFSTHTFSTAFRRQPPPPPPSSFRRKPLKLITMAQQQQHLTLAPVNGNGSITAPATTLLFDQQLLQKIADDALVWASLHGLVMGDKSVQRSGTVPGVGLVHAPFALFPTLFPESQWRQACDLAPIFNELVDRVSLDGKFLQESLSRTKEVDEFTSRLLDIHSKMLAINKKEEIRLGLHRSDYMLDEKTKSLLQIELNTISSSFAGLGSLVTELHRYILSRYGKLLGLDSGKVPANNAATQFAEGLARAWTEYNDPRAVIMIVVQAEERNMYDQHFLSAVLRDRHQIAIVRKTLAEVDREGEILPDGTLSVDGQRIAVVYFRAGYTPVDYPSESEWRARLLMEQSSAIKCPSISYHLVGTKKIQQELANPGVLERFLENKGDIAKLRECFAGLWSLDDYDITRKAIEKPELFVMKPQREGGGNNIYGNAVRETLLKLQQAGSQEDAAYILMQRIFPTLSAAVLMRNGCWHKDHAVSELGIFSTYLRNKDRVVMNNQSGYLMRTKISSSDEGGVAAGFAVLDSVYLT
ncbi:glutathione synthetase, chloroplastic-like [Lotus japonicus]|uniref:Glutathione synthetase n=1 Tax=Lotus japonicus TaxID=34305 RepID=Q93XE5_LOTJA|nr:glutathione synthetase, chloroplastic-like [Lotus japonicus]XP_057439419.1 glutathione synthetase, chloroplastic-like [Lotus japonicus]XP_057439420.1 glutathione synthetase, chloroplastic-like [Lotus japonicus]AAK77663.2 glutathione synthetase [Lotus japonicus]AAP69599.1 glutathione synthetase [Lotus japonicus]